MKNGHTLSPINKMLASKMSEFKLLEAKLSKKQKDDCLEIAAYVIDKLADENGDVSKTQATYLARMLEIGVLITQEVKE